MIAFSVSYLSRVSIPLTIEAAAYSPCTIAGQRTSCAYGFLLVAILMISLIAAPVDAVTIPILLEYLGIDFRVITKLVKSKESYNICERVKKTNPYLIKLIGIKIIEAGDIL